MKSTLTQTNDSKIIDYKEMIKEKYGDNFIVIGNSTINPNQLILQHKDCKKNFFVDGKSFFEQPICPNCHKKYYNTRYNKEKTDTEFRKEVKDIFGDKITLLTPYINSRVKIMIKCTECNKVRPILPYPLIHGYQCSCHPKPRKSKGKLKRTTESFKQEVKDLVGDEYTVLGEYKGANVKTLMKHNICDHTFKIEPVRFLKQGIRCLHCNRNYPKTSNEYEKQVKELCGNDFKVKTPYINAKTKVEIECMHCNKSRWYNPRNFLLLNKCPSCGQTKKTIRKEENKK